MIGRSRHYPLTEGLRVRLTSDVERFPHFIAREGMTGTVIEATDDLVAVRMDDYLPGADEWDNEVCWMAEDDHDGELVYPNHPTAISAAWRDIARTD